MKRFFSGVLLLVFFLSCGSTFADKILEGEAVFISRPIPSAGTTYVDYIVSTHDLGGWAAEDQFVFSTLNSGPGEMGDYAAYTSSTYFYYYQLENNSETCTTSLLQLTLNLDPSNVLSAGYIMGADIDDMETFDHNMWGKVGEHEDVNAPIVDPFLSHYDTESYPQYQTWSYPGTVELPVGSESSVLFVTSHAPPVQSPALLLNGSPFDGILPTPPSPTETIPEPFTMILLGSGLVGLFIKRRK